VAQPLATNNGNAATYKWPRKTPSTRLYS